MVQNRAFATDNTNTKEKKAASPKARKTKVKEETKPSEQESEI